MIEVENHSFPNIGFISSKIPDSILEKLWKEIEEISSNRIDSLKSNANLVGQIQDEFYLSSSKEHLTPVLLELANRYNSLYPNYAKKRCSVIQSNLDLEIGNLWVNFQKKHEYNPGHNHSGLFSFTLWLKIPYDIYEEFALSNSINSRIRSNSVFNFSYINALGEMNNYKIDVDKSYEGMIVFFPSALWHSVNPFFTSNEERISVSGNIFAKVTN